MIDHLPGGIYLKFDHNLLEEVASVPTTNVVPECDFARLNRMIKEKPNANLVALESMILYSHNKMSMWLEQQTNEEKEKCIKAVRTLAPTIRAKFKERREAIEARRTVALMKKKEDISRRNLQAVKEKEIITKEIEKLHLWTSRSDIKNGLAQFSRQCDKIQALKLQITFHDKVLNQASVNKSVFKFSYKGKQYSVDQLTENLCQLLGDSESVQVSGQQSTSLLELITLQPELLVGK